MTGQFIPFVRRVGRWHPGLPVVVLGSVFVVYGLAHFYSRSDPLPIDLIVVALLEALAAIIIYGGYQMSVRGLSTLEGIHAFAATVLFGLIGFVVATALITLQLLKGVVLTDIVFLIVVASATTAALGVGLALYYFELRAQRAALVTQHETVENLNKRLTVLQRVLRHNLRNEITVIQGHAETLLDQVDAEAKQHSLRMMLRHVNRIESLSENASRLQRVWEEDATVEQDAAEILEESVAEVEAVGPAVDVTTNIPECALVEAHPMFKQAMVEALRNAVNHNDRAETDITATVERLDGAQMDVEVRVADTGTGTPEYERRVLDLAEENPLEHGTGLGLWLIYWIIEKSEGNLRYESNDPHGTIIRIQLPAKNP